MCSSDLKHQHPRALPGHQHFVRRGIRFCAGPGTGVMQDLIYECSAVIHVHHSTHIIHVHWAHGLRSTGLRLSGRQSRIGSRCRSGARAREGRTAEYFRILSRESTRSQRGRGGQQKHSRSSEFHGEPPLYTAIESGENFAKFECERANQIRTVVGFASSEKCTNIRNISE